MTDERPDPVLVLQPQGPLDVDSCGELRRQLAAAFSVDIVVIGVDLSGVTLLDRTALDTLSGASRYLSKRGGDLRVLRAADGVASTLRVNGLGALLDSRPPALRVVRGSGQGGPRTAPCRLVVVPGEPLRLPG